MLRSRLAPAPASYEWLFDLLVGRTATVSWAAAGALPPAFRAAEQFAVLPAGNGRSFFVSLASRRGAASALTSYNSLRTPRPRLARRVLALGLRTGLAQPLLGSRIEVGAVAEATGDDVADVLLSGYLRELFSRDDIIVAAGGGSGPYRKPVLQVFGADGVPLGYVKVGWNAWSRDAVRREAAALEACAARPMRLGVPTLLDHCERRGMDLVVTAPMPARVRRMSGTPQLPDISVLREITELSPVRAVALAASPWWQDIRSRIGTRAGGPGSWLAAVAQRIEDAHGGTTLAFGRWHGDLTPWNLARLGDRVYAWDWESSSAEAPVGFDALHFHFQVAFVARRVPLAQAAALAARKATAALAELGVAASQYALLAQLHLLELSVRHEEARSSTGDADERFYPAITSVVGPAAPAAALGLAS